MPPRLCPRVCKLELFEEENVEHGNSRTGTISDQRALAGPKPGDLPRQLLRVAVRALDTTPRAPLRLHPCPLTLPSPALQKRAGEGQGELQPIFAPRNDSRIS